jgi:hypothetical protein
MEVDDNMEVDDDLEEEVVAEAGLEETDVENDGPNRRQRKRAADREWQRQ